jgi:hypothetical protein
LQLSAVLGTKAGGRYSTTAYEKCLFKALQEYVDPNRTLGELGQGRKTKVHLN